MRGWEVASYQMAQWDGEKKVKSEQECSLGRRRWLWHQDGGYLGVRVALEGNIYRICKGCVTI